VTWGNAIKGEGKNYRPFHYDPPNFLSSLVTLAVAWDESSRGQALKLEPADSAQGRIYRCAFTVIPGGVPTLND
jgi:hypothetical protein